MSIMILSFCIKAGGEAVSHGTNNQVECQPGQLNQNVKIKFAVTWHLMVCDMHLTSFSVNRKCSCKDGAGPESKKLP